MTEVNYHKLLSNPFSIPGLMLERYAEMGLDEKEIMVILHVFYAHQQGLFFPSPGEIAAKVTFSEREVALILRKLIQRGLLEIKNSDNKIGSETYVLDRFWDQLFKEEDKQEQQPPNEEEAAIFILFEQEFGRPLSPFEIETINLWIDEDVQPPALIKAALREAVLMSKLNFRYIDRILREWKRKGIKSVEQARNQSKAFHENQRPVPAESSSHSSTKRDTSVYYNWLEEE